MYTVLARCPLTAVCHVCLCSEMYSLPSAVWGRLLLGSEHEVLLSPQL